VSVSIVVQVPPPAGRRWNAAESTPEPPSAESEETVTEAPPRTDPSAGAVSEPVGPVLRDFPDDAEPGDQPAAPPQASGITPATVVPDDVAMEATEMRRYHERWLEKSGRTLFGLTGIPPTQFRGVVRFLEGFAGGQDVDMPERPPDVPLPNFIRYCADDLKALYFEGHLTMKPAAGGAEIARWFWGETAAGQLLRRVRDRLDGSDDPRWKAAAFGIAR